MNEKTKLWGGKPYQTWINHGLIAAAIMFLFSLVLSPAESAALAVWGYTFRELDQLQRRLYTRVFAGDTRSVPWMDHFMDVVAPIAACAILYFFLVFRV